jgi:Family of unknown function (DUF5681)
MRMEARVEPADSLQKAGQAGERTADGRFAQGRSGNPAGRQRGSKNRATLAAQLLLEGQAEALTNKAVELALGGDVAALRLCLTRIAAPRREPAVQFDLPPLDNLRDVAGAMAAVAAAAADGVITPGEAFALSRVLDALLRAIEAREAERRKKHFWSGQTRDAP